MKHFILHTYTYSTKREDTLSASSNNKTKNKIVTIEIYTIVLYLLIAVLITVILGDILYKKGATLLHYIFHQQKEWAKPVNKIMLSGFYLLNIGIATLYYNQGIELESNIEAFNFLSSKIGGLLIIIGGMHIFNVLFFLLIKWDYLTLRSKTQTSV